MKSNILDLDPLFRDDAIEFLKQLNGTAYKFIISQVKRTKAEQEALYAQGRKAIEVVNHLRDLAGMTAINPNQNKIVTQTLKSRHLANPQGFSEAFDIVAIDRRTGNAIWDDTKTETPYKLAYTLSLAFKKLQAGYEWGWDKGHYQRRV